MIAKRWTLIRRSSNAATLVCYVSTITANRKGAPLGGLWTRRGGLRPTWRSGRSCSVISAAGAKGAVGRLDFNFAAVLSARGEPECAARGLNDRAAGALVWIIHKLVEPNL